MSPFVVEPQAILLGALVGDALAAPWQGLRQGHIQQLHGGHVEGFHPTGHVMPEKPERNTLPGLHGIAGQRLMAAMAAGIEDASGRGEVARVAAALVELAGEDGEPMAHRWGALRAPGRPLRRALTRWRTEYPWEDAEHFAKEEPSGGAGCAVLGLVPTLLGVDDAGLPERLARLTHFRAPAVMAPVMVHLVMRRLLEELRGRGGRKLDAEGIVRDALAQFAPLEDDYMARHAVAWRDLGWGGRPRVTLTDALAPLGSLLREANDDLAVRTLVNTAAEQAPDQPVTHPQHGHAATALAWALYRGLGALAPVAALEDIVNRGGETGLVATVAGAFLAARHGLENFSEEWMVGLLITREATALVTAHDAGALEAWLAAEHRLTAAEEANRAPLHAALEKQRRLAAEREKKHPGGKPPAVQQGDLPFAPPPSAWLPTGDAEEDPEARRRAKEARGRKRIDWKENRRDQHRHPHGPPPEPDEP